MQTAAHKNGAINPLTGIPKSSSNTKIALYEKTINIRAIMLTSNHSENLLSVGCHFAQWQRRQI